MNLIVWLVLCLIWGSTWLFIKLGLRDLPPFTFAGIRFLLASVILWTIVIAWRRPLPKNWLVTKIEVTKTMLISLVTPVTALLIGWLTLNEKLSWRVAAGSAAILAGIWLIVFQRRGSKIEDRAAL